MDDGGRGGAAPNTNTPDGGVAARMLVLLLASPSWRAVPKSRHVSMLSRDDLAGPVARSCRNKSETGRQVNEDIVRFTGGMSQVVQDSRLSFQVK